MFFLNKKNHIPKYKEYKEHPLFLCKHRWFYFLNKINMDYYGFNEMGIGYFEKRICEKCFIFESRQYKEKDSYGRFSWFGYGKFAYKQLIKQKLIFFNNPTNRNKNGRYFFIEEHYCNNMEGDNMEILYNNAINSIDSNKILSKQLELAIQEERYEDAVKIKRKIQGAGKNIFRNIKRLIVNIF